jgi:hypothetical protein
MRSPHCDGRVSLLAALQNKKTKWPVRSAPNTCHHTTNEQINASTRKIKPPSQKYCCGDYSSHRLWSCPCRACTGHHHSEQREQRAPSGESSARDLWKLINSKEKKKKRCSPISQTLVVTEVVTATGSATAGGNNGVLVKQRGSSSWPREMAELAMERPNTSLNPRRSTRGHSARWANAMAILALATFVIVGNSGVGASPTESTWIPPAEFHHLHPGKLDHRAFSHPQHRRKAAELMRVATVQSASFISGTSTSSRGAPAPPGLHMDSRNSSTGARGIICELNA